ncbi:hypothetical protein AO057_01890 [Curvibacter sp. PAE-UM]|nr:hypothetical protein AO057_01890 [Curvibacter sp. PAE-UM]
MSFKVLSIVNIDAKVPKEFSKRAITEIQDIAATHLKEILKNFPLPKLQRCHFIFSIPLGLTTFEESGAKQHLHLTETLRLILRAVPT